MYRKFYINVDDKIVILNYSENTYIVVNQKIVRPGEIKIDNIVEPLKLSPHINQSEYDENYVKKKYHFDEDFGCHRMYLYRLVCEKCYYNNIVCFCSLLFKKMTFEKCIYCVNCREINKVLN
jgi:hypothetical protein